MFNISNWLQQILLHYTLWPTLNVSSSVSLSYRGSASKDYASSSNPVSPLFSVVQILINFHLQERQGVGVGGGGRGIMKTIWGKYMKSRKRRPDGKNRNCCCIKNCIAMDEESSHDCHHNSVGAHAVQPPSLLRWCAPPRKIVMSPTLLTSQQGNTHYN